MCQERIHVLFHVYVYARPMSYVEVRKDCLWVTWAIFEWFLCIVVKVTYLLCCNSNLVFVMINHPVVHN